MFSSRTTVSTMFQFYYLLPFKRHTHLLSPWCGALFPEMARLWERVRLVNCWGMKTHTTTNTGPRCMKYYWYYIICVDVCIRMICVNTYIHVIYIYIQYTVCTAVCLPMRWSTTEIIDKCIHIELLRRNLCQNHWMHTKKWYATRQCQIQIEINTRRGELCKVINRIQDIYSEGNCWCEGEVKRHQPSCSKAAIRR